MSYGVSSALQKAVYSLLAADAGLDALIGSAIFDAAPSGPVPVTYVALGPEDAFDRSDATGGGAEHRFIVSVVSEDEGFAAVKAIAGAVSDILTGALPVLDRGRVVAIWFDRASAKRTGTAGRVRRVDLRFRARVEDI